MHLITRKLGRTDYAETLANMQSFTKDREAHTADELWLTEHAPIYTLGLNRKNVRMPNNAIPVQTVDRGGKITYHGPGQIIIYTLLDLKKRKLNIRSLVDMMEGSIIALLAEYNVVAYAKKDAPGVYIDEAKIASVGLRLKNNCCYHGLSLNADMDLSPFSAIDPCGYQGLAMTQTKDLNIEKTPEYLGEALLRILESRLTA